MRDYEFAERAVRDIKSARDWYDSRAKDLGNRFVDSVLQVIHEVREHPERFAECLPGVRAVGCIGFPYRVYYEARPNRVIVRAVYHAARNPSRWHDEDRQ